jgi:hypothetical protein
MFTLTKHPQDIDGVRQAGEGATAESEAALSAVEITSQEIAVMADYLESVCSCSAIAAKGAAREVILLARRVFQ